MIKIFFSFIFTSLTIAAVIGQAYAGTEPRDRLGELKDCKTFIMRGFREIPEERNKRFLGKVSKETANCRGGSKAVKYRHTPWIDWANYWAAGDASTKALQGPTFTALGKHLKPNGRGIDGALTDIEYQRIELIKFNLFDNQTYEGYIRGSSGTDGRTVKIWDEMRLPKFI